MFSLDFIGDIHGNAQALRVLLDRLGYRPHRGGYRHPEIRRMAVFTGDYIDRGPASLETVNIVRAMRESGDAWALMGNHEYNALALGLTRADGKPYRSHKSSVMTQHAAFLAEAPIGSKAHDEAMRFFASLSITYQGRNVRAVHAAWIDDAVASINPFLTRQQAIDRGNLAEALTEGATLYNHLQPVLKGPEIKVPKEMAWTDSHGAKRTKNRVRWWNPSPSSLAEAIVLEGTQKVDEALMATVPTFPQSDPRPVLFGHYCMLTKPTIVTPKATCLDFGIDKGGHLVAYTFSGETEFAQEKLTAVAI